MQLIKFEFYIDEKEGFGISLVTYQFILHARTLGLEKTMRLEAK